MVEWNSGMEYWNDLLSLKSDFWGCYELQHLNGGTSHQSFLEKMGPVFSTAACQALPICLALTCESSINGGHSGS